MAKRDYLVIDLEATCDAELACEMALVERATATRTPIPSELSGGGQSPKKSFTRGGTAMGPSIFIPRSSTVGSGRLGRNRQAP